ncbi:penicillin-binding protein activator [Acinetobacter tianfuensis]|uniref:Penicillin-binding protein activator n=1 Tax=Acinetobacter tianfuensis TaxID=2419603 RepID=A0A3A8EHS9_9GAMM|nr:penicillin-binding protein activator [Acinetobacter tianfuensis]RKG30310.1 hypothetical protein D7V32_11510 [Acinetobacter tianfuensis]
MWKLIRNNKKKILTAILLGAGLSSAQAEVLVILPESGPMARAASSIKQGFSSAYIASGSKIPLKFVNSDQMKMSGLLKKHVTKKTQMIVGPLSVSEVDAIISAKPQIKVLTLNEGNKKLANVLQFSLAKRDDAGALAAVLHKDQIEEVLVYRELGTENENELFLMALMSQAEHTLNVVAEKPKKLKKNQGLLLLGSNGWLNSQSALPKKRIYTLANALEQYKPLPAGIKFCDSPAVHETGWYDMKHAYAAQPVSLPYQRLLAFGGDAWQITQSLLENPKTKAHVFEGRTGQLNVQSGQIRRTPHCYLYQAKGLMLLQI